MKSVGQILAGDDTPAPKKFDDDEPRMHRVTLASITFTEIEVMAVTVREAFCLAEQRTDKAAKQFSTCPMATSARVARLVDPREPSKGVEWVDRKP